MLQRQEVVGKRETADEGKEAGEAKAAEEGGGEKTFPQGTGVTENHSIFRFYINAKTTIGRVCNERERDRAGTIRASLFQEYDVQIQLPGTDGELAKETKLTTPALFAD